VIILAHNNLIGQVPSCICDESSPNLEQFNVFDNKLCPPYPTCTATGEGTIDGELWGYCANNGCQTFPGQVVDDYYPGQTDDQGNPEDEPVTCYDCDESDLDDCNVCYGDNICPPPLYMENGVWCTYEPDSNPDNVTWSGSNFDECGVCLGTCEYDGTGCEGSPCVDECNVPNGIGRGDLNRDGGWNVNDILKLIDCVLTGNCSNDWLTWEQARCVADINSDGSCGVLDIVTLVNCVLAENCGR
jgi:hypothetical protein